MSYWMSVFELMLSWEFTIELDCWVILLSELSLSDYVSFSLFSTSSSIISNFFYFYFVILFSWSISTVILFIVSLIMPIISSYKTSMFLSYVFSHIWKIWSSLNLFSDYLVGPLKGCMLSLDFWMFCADEIEDWEELSTEEILAFY